MKKCTALTGTLMCAMLSLLTVVPRAAVFAQAPKASHDSVKGNLLQTAEAAGHFSTLVRYIRRAGLADTVSNWGPFTIFAPTDAAFARLPRRTLLALRADPARLRALLLRHVLVGSAFKHHVVALQDAIMMSGDTVTIRPSHDGARLNGNANVTQWTLRASNGVIHTIDHVLLAPPRARAHLAVASRDSAGRRH